MGEESVGLSSDLNSFNQTYSGVGPFSGYMPYARSPGYSDPPEVVWAEGTWGALLLRLRLAENISSDLASMQRLQAVDPQGGFLQTTAGSRSQPYEFHVWPAVGGTAWAALVTGNSSMLWAPDGWPDQRSSAAAREDNVGAGAGSVTNYAIGTSAGSSAGQASSDSAGPARPGTTRQRSLMATGRRKRRRTRSGHRHARRAGRSQARPKN